MNFFLLSFLPALSQNVCVFIRVFSEFTDVYSVLLSHRRVSNNAGRTPYNNGCVKRNPLCWPYTETQPNPQVCVVFQANCRIFQFEFNVFSANKPVTGDFSLRKKKKKRVTKMWKNNVYYC